MSTKEDEYSRLCEPFETKSTKIDEVKAKSLPPEPVEVERTGEKMMLKERIITGIKKAVAVLLVVGISITTPLMVEDYIVYSNNQKNNNRINNVMVQILDKNFVDMDGYNSVVAKYSYPMEDHSGSYLGNQEIAKAILSLPDKYFESWIYSVYCSIEGLYPGTGLSNMNSIFYYIAHDPDLENHPNAFVKCFGINNFEDYLKNEGFVKTDGSYDIDAFITYCRANAEAKVDGIENLLDQLNVGGRNGI